MNPHFFLISSVIVFAGIICGIAIGKMAEEELKQGQKYFKLLLHTIYLGIIFWFFYTNPSLLFFICIGLLLIIFSFSKEREVLSYYVVGLMLSLSYLYNGFNVIAPLSFLSGFPIGSLYLNEDLKMKKISFFLAKYAPFLGIVFVVYVLLIV